MGMFAAVQVNELKKKLSEANEAIAKRDDLICRMSEWIRQHNTTSTATLPFWPAPYESDLRQKSNADARNMLITEAKELLGVK